MGSTAYADGGVPTGGGMGIRNGFSLNAGLYSGSVDPGGTDISATVFGLDWRIGLKISPSLAVYLDSHISFGPQKIGMADDFAGTLAEAAIVEYTLPQRVFFGAGGGYAIVDNPSGLMLQARAGWYPMAKSFETVSRRLNVALDFRYMMTSDRAGDVNVAQFSVSIGYDRF